MGGLVVLVFGSAGMGVYTCAEEDSLVGGGDHFASGVSNAARMAVARDGICSRSGYVDPDRDVVGTR